MPSTPPLSKHRRYYLKNAEKIKERARKWSKENPERNRDNKLRRKYGISTEQRDKMLAVQGLVCAICGTDTPRGRGGWHVDHCHQTQAVRGVLCNACNLMLGHARDNPETLSQAITYLKVFNGKEASNTQ